MSIDVVILSYNRPTSLERLLKSLSEITVPNVSIFINDDNSPNISEITEVVERYIEILNIPVTLILREKNIGYDENLMSSFSVGNGNYLFLMSDDDYFESFSCNDFFKSICRDDFDIGMVSFKYQNEVYRLPPSSLSNIIDKKTMYDSILFSGLIFNKKTIPDFTKYRQFLGNCIYTQVFLVSSSIAKGGRLKYFTNSPVLLGNDGENFFGKNDSSNLEESDLINRDSVLSNLNYQKRLIKVVRYINTHIDSGVFERFYSEYYKRLCGYLLKLPNKYRNQFLKQLSDEEFCLSNLQFFILKGLRYMPYWLSSKIYIVGRSMLRKSG
jgi:glycosyltransferase involved in cell wall biosynthesis